MDWRFEGRIIGIGSSSGVRLVIGQWDRSPLGSFADVMVQVPSGQRVLLAPTQAVAEFVCDTYVFDDVQVMPVVAEWTPEPIGGTCSVRCSSLDLVVRVGGRTPLGRLLGLLPAPLATAPAFARAVDPIARRVLPGVRTAGVARLGRREFYGARDVRSMTGIQGRYAGADLGTLADVWPPVTFGFSSVPRRPAMTTVVTTVRSVPV